MKKIEFNTVKEAIDFAKQHGGWLFYDKLDTAIWYDFAKYTRSDVIQDSPGAGLIGPYSFIEQNLRK